MELITYYKCACANCGAVIDYRADEAGQIVQCPKCGEKSQLPEPNKLVIVETHGPPVPEFKSCPVCGEQMRFSGPACSVCETARQRKRLAIQLAVAATVLVLVGIGGFAWWRSMNPRPGSELSNVHLNVPPDAAKDSAPGAGHMLLTQPRPRMPKSTNDLHAGTFTIERKRGSDLAVAVGDIQNISENVHTRLRADLDLLDRTGAKIGAVSDFCADLGAHQSWHFLATVTETNAMSVRFAGIKED